MRWRQVFPQELDFIGYSEGLFGVVVVFPETLFSSLCLKPSLSFRALWLGGIELVPKNDGRPEYLVLYQAA